MAVLILAEDIDATYDGMVLALQERGQVVHRVNAAWFPARLSVSARLRGDQWVGHLRTPGRVIELEEITAVWYRTPRAYQFPPSSPRRRRPTLTWRSNTASVER